MKLEEKELLKKVDLSLLECAIEDYEQKPESYDLYLYKKKLKEFKKYVQDNHSGDEAKHKSVRYTIEDAPNIKLEDKAEENQWTEDDELVKLKGEVSRKKLI